MVVVEVVVVTNQLRDGYDVVVGDGAAGLSGVWVAGNVTDLTAQVGTDAAAGAAAAAQINADLLAEETRQAVAGYRDPFSAGPESRLCDLVMGDRRHGL